MEKVKIGISRCLLGEKVRYNGERKQDYFLTETMGPYVDWRPVCPEVECGLGVPREAMHLVGNPAAPSLKTLYTNVDHTDRMMKWVGTGLRDLRDAGLCGFIFKSRSPSSGMRGVKIHTSPGRAPAKGAGIFAAAFMRRYPLIPVEDEERLHNPSLRGNFITRVFTLKRWRELLARDTSLKGLMEFHGAHKYLILSHSRAHSTALGRLLATPGNSTTDIQDKYITTLMEGLRLISTAGKNTDALLHMVGYFKKQLSHDEKEELLEAVADYRKGIMPLAVPLVLLRHYVLKHKEQYLSKQVYLYPNPAEFMLTNHP